MAWAFVLLCGAQGCGGFEDLLRNDLRPHLRGGTGPPPPIFGWLRETFPPEALVATSLAGRLPRYTGFRAIDLLGRNDDHIAHHGRRSHGAVDARSDTTYVLGRSPDLIESTIRASAVLGGGPIRRGTSFWREHEAETICDAGSRRDYVFLASAPCEGFDRSLFARRETPGRLAPDRRPESTEIGGAALAGLSCP